MNSCKIFFNNTNIMPRVEIALIVPKIIGAFIGA